MTDLKIETPAQGLSITGKYGDAVFYRIDCSCGSPDDSVDLSIEATDFGAIDINLATTQVTPWFRDQIADVYLLDINTFWGNLHYYAARLANGIWHRLKTTFKIWVSGKIEYYQSTSLTEQSALNLASALVQSIEDIDNFRLAAKAKKEKDEIEREAKVTFEVIDNYVNQPVLKD